MLSKSTAVLLNIFLSIIAPPPGVIPTKEHSPSALGAISLTSLQIFAVPAALSQLNLLVPLWERINPSLDAVPSWYLIAIVGWVLSPVAPKNLLLIGLR